MCSLLLFLVPPRPKRLRGPDGRFITSRVPTDPESITPDLAPTPLTTPATMADPNATPVPIEQQVADLRATMMTIKTALQQLVSAAERARTDVPAAPPAWDQTPL
jgi:hypothetical protein